MGLLRRVGIHANFRHFRLISLVCGVIPFFWAGRQTLFCDCMHPRMPIFPPHLSLQVPRAVHSLQTPTSAWCVLLRFFFPLLLSSRSCPFSTSHPFLVAVSCAPASADPAGLFFPRPNPPSPPLL